jgi:F-type H+-transporting ATPase subunit epsilon
MFLEIITPEKKIFEGEVSSVLVPGGKGRFQMLDKHAAIISTLINGQVKVKTASGESSFDVKGGVVEMLQNKVIILAETA